MGKSPLSTRLFVFRCITTTTGHSPFSRCHNAIQNGYYKEMWSTRTLRAPTGNGPSGNLTGFKPSSLRSLTPRDTWGRCLDTIAPCTIRKYSNWNCSYRSSDSFCPGFFSRKKGEMKGDPEIKEIRWSPFPGFLPKSKASDTSSVLPLLMFLIGLTKYGRCEDSKICLFRLSISFDMESKMH